MRRIHAIFAVVSTIFFSFSAFAAWPDSSEGRIKAVSVLRADLATPFTSLQGEERENMYQSACDLKYFPSCNYKEWTTPNGTGDLIKAGEFFGKRCKKEPLSCVVSGWSNGYVNGTPSTKAPNTALAIKHFSFGCTKKAYAPACSAWGEMVMYGVGGKSDYAKAKSLFEEACKAKDGFGCYRIGTLHENGWGVEKDIITAKKHYDAGCQAGYTEACVDLGRLYENGTGVAKNYETAMAFYKTACQNKNGDGCFYNAKMFAEGKGVENSEGIAFGLYAQICGSGDQRGCYGMGTLYERGRGIKKDGAKAIELYQQSCDSGYSVACTKLGESLIAGKITESAPDLGASYIEQGCEGGDGRGCVRLGQLLLKGKFMDKDPQRALSIFEKACEGNQGFGCYALGRAYRDGESVTKDEAKAIELFNEGCENEHGPSCGILALPYMSGSKKDIKQAVKYFSRGCKFQDGISCRAMGDFHKKGEGVEKSIEQAFSSYDNGCGYQDAKSCFMASQMIVDGLVEVSSFYQALLGFDFACDNGVDEACSAGEPIMFQARFEGIVERAFESQMCQVWTFSEDNPELNMIGVKVKGDVFNVLEGPHKGTIFNTTHLRNDFTQKKSVKKAHSYWKLEGNGKTIKIEHHENWNTNRIGVQSFPEDESFSLDAKGGESVFYSRSRETLMRNQSKKCRFINDAELLTSEYCSDVQALIASQLLSTCR